MFKESYTFGDVLLVPKYSEIPSRNDVDLTVDVKKMIFSHPFIPANMASIFEEAMAEKIVQTKGLGFIHRFMHPIDQLNIICRLEKKYNDVWNNIGCSVGVKKSDYEWVDTYVSKGVKIICIDIAHGDSKSCVDMCKYISTNYPHVLLVAGNVATGLGAKRLWDSGADIVKVGIGSSGICTTRLETGNGVPQLSAIIDCKNIKDTYFSNQKKYIISDGGISQPGDIGKALVFADMVMLGNMFSGIDENPGELIEVDNLLFKRYDGSSTHKNDRIEGIKSLVDYKGSFDSVFKRLKEGLESCCSYQGVNNLNDLKFSEFIKITNASVVESGIHDVKRVK